MAKTTTKPVEHSEASGDESEAEVVEVNEVSEVSQPPKTEQPTEKKKESGDKPEKPPRSSSKKNKPESGAKPEVPAIAAKPRKKNFEQILADMQAENEKKFAEMAERQKKTDDENRMLREEVEKRIKEQEAVLKAVAEKKKTGARSQTLLNNYEYIEFENITDEIGLHFSSDHTQLTPKQMVEQFYEKFNHYIPDVGSTLYHRIILWNEKQKLWTYFFIDDDELAKNGNSIGWNTSSGSLELHYEVSILKISPTEELKQEQIRIRNIFQSNLSKKCLAGPLGMQNMINAHIMRNGKQDVLFRVQTQIFNCFSKEQVGLKRGRKTLTKLGESINKIFSEVEEDEDEPSKKKQLKTALRHQKTEEKI